MKLPMTDTPRTDTLDIEATRLEKSALYLKARKLLEEAERELAAAKSSISEADQAHTKGGLRKRIQELEADIKNERECRSEWMASSLDRQAQLAAKEAELAAARADLAERTAELMAAIHYLPGEVTCGELQRARDAHKASLSYAERMKVALMDVRNHLEFPADLAREERKPTDCVVYEGCVMSALDVIRAALSLNAQEGTNRLRSAESSDASGSGSTPERQGGPGHSTNAQARAKDESLLRTIRAQTEDTAKLGAKLTASQEYAERVRTALEKAANDVMDIVTDWSLLGQFEKLDQLRETVRTARRALSLNAQEGTPNRRGAKSDMSDSEQESSGLAARELEGLLARAQHTLQPCTSQEPCYAIFGWYDHATDSFVDLPEKADLKQKAGHRLTALYSVSTGTRSLDVHSKGNSQ
jgi:hypothetical protein